CALLLLSLVLFFSSRRRHTRSKRDWSSDVCSSDLLARAREALDALIDALHERGWVLGAPPGGGLGARADGTVMVIDLRGLRREEIGRASCRERVSGSGVDETVKEEGRTK